MQNSFVVIDNGSDTLKVGYSGEDAPRACVQTVVAKPASPDRNNKKLPMYFGEDALNKDSSHYNLSYPIQYGTITNWQDMEYLWDYCYSNKLGIKSEDYGVLMTEGPLNTKPNRENMIQVMFEKFKVPQFHVANQMLLALYASGRTTGMILDIGHNVTHAVPAYEGYVLPHAISKVNFGGADLTEKIKKELKEENLDERVIRDIKEKCCYVPFSKDGTVHSDQKYALPDGEVISVSDSVAKCPELLFKLLKGDNGEFQGIQDMIYKAVHKCDPSIRKGFYSNIVLSGGSSSFKGIDERLQSELGEWVPSGMSIKIAQNGDRKIQTWAGGALLGSLSTLEPMLVSKKEYEEHGPSIVHKKCC